MPVSRIKLVLTGEGALELMKEMEVVIVLVIAISDHRMISKGLLYWSLVSIVFNHPVAERNVVAPVAVELFEFPFP